MHLRYHGKTQKGNIQIIVIPQNYVLNIKKNSLSINLHKSESTSDSVESHKKEKFLQLFFSKHFPLF